MKLEIHEYDGCFSYEIEPESMKDQVMLARLAKNATKELRSFSVFVQSDLTMCASLVVGKRKNTESAL